MSVPRRRIRVGMVHTGHTATIEAADSIWRINNSDGLVAGSVLYQ